jgi:tight adherence protein B
MTLDLELLIIFGGIAGFFVIFTLSLMNIAGGARRKMNKRAEALHNRLGSKAEIHKAKASLKKELESHTPGLDRIAGRYLPRPSVLSKQLKQAGIGLSLGTYAATCVVLLAVVALGLVLVLKMKIIVGVAAGIFLGVGLPHAIVKFLVAKRDAAFTTSFPDAIDLIVRGVKSGLPITEGINVVGKEIPDPVGGVFRGITDSMKFGRTLEESLWDAVENLDTPEFKFFVISLVVQSETGGNLAETLGNLSEILRQRQQMKLKIRAMASEARASTMILGGLPFFVLAVLFFINPTYLTPMFTDDIGQLMLGGALFSIVTGITVMVKMARFEI